ncbi:MAG: P44/Msp2 family outer membrane protein [Ehrlichia sp.]
MNNKNRFTVVGISMACLLLPNMSFSEATITNIPSGLYISGQYKPSVSAFSDFSVKETNVITERLIALRKDVDSIDIGTTSPSDSGIGKPDNFNIPYKVEFQDNAISFSGSIGYSFHKGPRIEMEVSYEKFDVKNPGGYVVNDAFRYFALARQTQDIGRNGVVTLQPQSDTSGSNVFYTVMRNDGVGVLSHVINACYDFFLYNLPVLPYICGGVGLDAIEFFDSLHIKLAGQAKVGITYSLSSNINLFADGYYHKVMGGNQFKNLRVQHVAELSYVPKVTSAVSTLTISYFGGEIGIRYIF